MWILKSTALPAHSLRDHEIGLHADQEAQTDVCLVYGRHRVRVVVTQAGALQGSLLETMKTACRGGGLSSLYWGYTGFIIKAIPYDVSELFTYSMLNDARSSHPLLQTLSPELTHMSIGTPFNHWYGPRNRFAPPMGPKATMAVYLNNRHTRHCEQPFATVIKFTIT
jgi:hypothetical protein